ncbi:MAG: helix-turn-helix transcriptional regulator [Bacilli bacterium]|nr:helix-turn-helix transcriptional regulator [Bacilli bacterium]
MTFLDLLAFKHLSITDLSKKSGVANSTVNDIAHGRYDLIDCSGRILQAFATALKIKIEDLLALEKEEATTLLPSFLNDSITKYRKAIKNEDFSADCYSIELNSSINVAEVENLISKETANRLRRRYF